MRNAINKDKISSLQLLDPVDDNDNFRDYWLITFKNENNQVFYSIKYPTETAANSAFDQMVTDYGLVNIETAAQPGL